MALAGGVARGIFHLEILEKLDDLGVEIDAISSSSICAFIVVCYSRGTRSKEILDQIIN
ncbi:patatin-like phospholipase family protein [Campylobacter portucalensis]|uniref:patatin-like phospholipase family protein n=1 Tax=Campylobacter portucalensis TaxID=2608384 RepID=UPI0038994AA7